MMDSVPATSEPLTCISSEHFDVPEDPFGDEEDDKRLWVGNLDSRVTEFTVLKLVEKFGAIRKMDFIYHKAGPDKGKSKGYCFVSFHTWESAEKARKALDGKFILSRPMYVKWAQGSRQNESTARVVSQCISQVKESSSSSLPPAPVTSALTSSSSLATAASIQSKIEAIEAKLHLMEQTQKDFSIGAVIKPPPGFTPISLTARQETHSSRTAPYRKHPSAGPRHKKR